MTYNLYLMLATFVLVFLGLLLLIVRSNKRVSQLMHSQHELTQRVDNQNKLLQRMTENVDEIREGALGMGAKLKTMTQTMQSVELKQQELENIDPDSRLYTKAAKLAESGATVDELMQECELPRAEAELLLSLHNK